MHMNLKRSDPSLSFLSTAFYILHVGGVIGLLLITLTCVLSKRVQRPLTFINFWITWIIYSITYTFLLFTTHPSPQSVVCRIQAAMISGVSPLAATAGLATVLQMWSNFHASGPYLQERPLYDGKRINVRLLSLLLCPYLILSGFSVTSAFYAVHNPQFVEAPTGLYCTVSADAFSRYTVPLYCIVVTVLVILVEAITILQFWSARNAVDKAMPLMKRENEIHCLIRVMLFTLGAMILLSCGIFYVSNAEVSWPYMAQSAVPLFCVIIFGSQPDILAVWCFWRRMPHRKVHIDIPIPSARTDVVLRSATEISSPFITVSCRTSV